MARRRATASVGYHEANSTVLLLRADTRPKVIDSRSGSLFCNMCDDFVWDPTLEDLRNRKIDTGTFSSKPFSHSLPAFMPGFERPRRHKSVHAS